MKSQEDPIHLAKESRAILTELQRQQDERWRLSKTLAPVGLPAFTAGRSPTHFLTCGYFSAFICAPELGAGDCISLAADFGRSVKAYAGPLISVGSPRLFDLSNSHNPDFYHGCYVLRSDVAGGAVSVVVMPQEGVTAEQVVACERLCREHFNVARLETILTTQWLNSVAQDMVEVAKAPADDGAYESVVTSSDDEIEQGEERPAARRGR